MVKTQGYSILRRAESVLKTLVFSGCLLSVIPAYAIDDCSVSDQCLDQLQLLLNAADNAKPVAENARKSDVSISVDGETIVGEPSRDDVNRQTDVDLEKIDIQVKFDGLSADRHLSVDTLPRKRVHLPNEIVQFKGRWNYPDWIERAEVRIYAAGTNSKRGSYSAVGGAPYQVIELSRDGNGEWLTPGDSASEGDYVYSVRVYDAQGRYDETTQLPLVVSSDADRLPKIDLPFGTDGRGIKQERPASVDNGYGENQIVQTNIPVYGGAVTVYGKNLPAGYKVNILGRDVPVADNDAFVIQEILPPGDHVVGINVTDDSGAHGVEFQRDINIPDNEWFYVGIADVTVGKRFGKDSNQLTPAIPGEYDSVYKKGRVAFYLKGKVKGRYLITASLDTREEDLDTLFSNLDKKDPRQLLRRLDPDDYYPVYGDDSTLKEDAPTSGKFYVRVERDKSHVMWGNFKTRIDGVELARYERGLYGGHTNLQTEQVTSFGKPIAKIEAFAAQPGTLPQRDEYRGTGGSVYFLKRQDINQGSEQISIEVRDASTGLVIDRRLLSEGEDYSIDYVQGVILLTNPLASSTSSGSAVLGASLASYQQFLVAVYEFTPAIGDLDGYSVGGRGEAWIFDAIRLGATGYSETTGIADQTLVGADATWRLSENSYFQLEWAQSKGNTFATVVSTDGGFIFNPISGDGVNGAAEAWRARLHLDMGELTKGGMQGSVGFGYEERAKGFNAPGRYTPTDETITDAHIELKPNDKVSVLARFDSIKRSDGVSKSELNSEAKVRVTDDYSVQAGVAYSDTQSPKALLDGTGTRTDVGARLIRHGFGEDQYYVFAQKTVAKDATRSRNDRVGVGFIADVTDKIRAEAEASYGTSGIGLLAALSYQPNSSDKYYVGYRMTPEVSGGDLLSYDPFNRDNGTLVTGMRRKISETTTAWTENNLDMMGTSQGLLQTYGVEFTPDTLWTIGAGIEAGYIEDEVSGSFERYAPSLSFGFKDEGKTFGAKLEARFESSADGSRDRTTWLARSNLGLQYDDDWRFLAKVDAVISQSDQSDIQNADYVEGSIGWAYRPVNNDRLNALFKYTYLHDLPAAEQLNQDNVLLGPKQRSHVVSADFIYDLSKRLSVGAKYGVRTGEISVSRTEADFVRSTAQLGIIRADYHVVKNWDVLVEGRALWLNSINQVHYGAVAGIYRHIGENLKVGVGYNFGKFSDDLTDLTLNDQGVFVNVIGKF